MHFSGLLAFGAVIFLATGTPARAEALSEARIKAFFDESIALMQAGNTATDEQVEKFFDDHVARKAMFKSTIMYDIPGYPPQMRNVALNKTDYIKNILDGRRTMKDFSSSVTLKKADIKGDTATVKTDGTESGSAPMEGAENLVPFEGRSSCNQIIKDDGGTVVLVSAACETIITFKE